YEPSTSPTLHGPREPSDQTADAVRESPARSGDAPERSDHLEDSHRAGARYRPCRVPGPDGHWRDSDPSDSAPCKPTLRTKLTHCRLGGGPPEEVSKALTENVHAVLCH